MKSHSFALSAETGRCVLCDRHAGDVAHILTLAGSETVDDDRAAAAGLALAEDLTALMRTPKADVSAKAGRMERNSPLFFGQGDNPTLF